MQNEFVQKTKFDASEYVGTITDGRYKLDVLLYRTNNDDITYEIGIKLRLVGDLQENGIHLPMSQSAILKFIRVKVMLTITKYFHNNFFFICFYRKHIPTGGEKCRINFYFRRDNAFCLEEKF